MPAGSMLLAHIGRIGDLGEADRAGRPVHRAALDARVLATSVCSRCAPMRRIFSASARRICATAPPANTIERDAKVPKPNGAVAVSP